MGHNEDFLSVVVSLLQGLLEPGELTTRVLIIDIILIITVVNVGVQNQECHFQARQENGLAVISTLQEGFLGL